jgi:hypothetical protein
MRPFPHSVFIVVLVFSFADNARADMLPSWGVEGSFSTPNPLIGLPNGGFGADSTQFQYYNGGNYYLVGMAAIPWNRPVNLTFDHVPYTATLTLWVEQPSTTSLSRVYGSLTFTGILNGNPYIANGPGSVTNTIIGPSQQSLDVGNHHFNVTFLPFIPFLDWPDTPGSMVGQSLGNPSHGYIFAGISADGIVQAPEPSALALAGLGLLSCSIAVWRKRRGRLPVGMQQ